MNDQQKIEEKIREIKALPEGDKRRDKISAEVQELMFGEIEDLHPDLEPWVTEGSMGVWVKHPLVFAALHLPQFNANINRQYEQKSQAVEDMWAEENYQGIVWAHERAYRLHAFLDVHEYLDDHAYWELLGAIWTDSENIWQNEQDWIDLLHAEREGREFMMEEKEREALAKLPETLTIYRGFDQEERESGLSWTLDKKRAEWFAKRLWWEDKSEIGPMLAEATVKRDDVVAHFLGRGEDEIVVLPEDIDITKVVPVNA